VQLDARSLVAVPLYHRRQLIGVLQVMSPRPHAFDDRSARALEMMCGFLGATMSHASDFQQQVAHANQTEGALRRSEKLPRSVATRPALLTKSRILWSLSVTSYICSSIIPVSTRLL